MNKEYLGDGVYVDFDGYHIVLTTEDGVSATNTIFMDGAVITQLEAYIAKQSSRRAGGDELPGDQA